MLKKLTLNKDFINKAVKFMSIIMLAFILLIMFFVDTRVEYNYRNDVKLNNYIFFLVAFLIIGILFALKKLLKNKQDKVQKIISKIESKSTLIIVILFILLIIFQVLMIRNLYFETKWDLEHVIGTLRNFLETGVFDNHAYIGTYPYFSIYPNNLFLANLFCVIGKMVMVFFQEKYVYGALVIIGTILVDISGILTVKTIGNFTDKKIFKIIGMIGFMAFIGVSPWLLVPYSDTYSIMFPIAVLYNYTKKDKKLYNYLLIGLCSYLGYLIKPTVIIVFIAIAIIESFRLLTKIKIKDNRIQRTKKVAKNIIFVLIGMFLVFLLKFGLSKVTNYEPEKQYEISSYHYLMMGINKETTGAYNGDDVVNSISQNSYEERVAYNKQVFLERLKSMSAKDLAEFYTKKILVNYNDGTLAWGREGGFYDIVNNKDDRLANIMKNFYYNDGSLFYIFTDIMQFIWIFILVFVFICAILKKFDKNISVAFSILVIAGIACVLAIIEVCEFSPPSSVIIPATFLKSSFAVSEVVSSVATIMVFGFNLLKSIFSSFSNFPNTLFFISKISLDLEAIYSSSIFSKICMTLLNPTSTAYSALYFEFLIAFSVSEINEGSCIIITYACIISASVPLIFFICISVSLITCFNAS